MAAKKRKTRKVIPAAELPQFCDYSCPHAQFAEADAVGACRRDQAVHCTLFSQYNNKNSLCIGHRTHLRS